MYTKNLTHAYSKFKPVLELARILPRRSLTRVRWLTFSGFIIIASAVIATTTIATEYYTEALLGLLLIFFGLWLEQVALYFYHNWYYFQGLDSIIGSAHKTPAPMTYEVAEVIHANPKDLTTAFFRSDLGSQVATRLGVDPMQLESFLKEKRPLISAEDIALPNKETFTLAHLVQALMRYDTRLAPWLQAQGIQSMYIPGAVQFVLAPYYTKKRQARWWSRDQLSMVGGFGRSLSYGTPYELDRYSRSLASTAIYTNFTTAPDSIKPYVTEVEQTLSRDRMANILLIGEPGVGKLDILLAVQQRLQKNQALNSLSDLELILLDTERLLATNPEQAALENELITILNQAADAGNVVIVIEHISHFIAQAAQVGVAIPELVDEYLAIPSLHIIGTGTPGQFNQSLSQLAGFTRRFHEIIVTSASQETTIQLLESMAMTQEVRRPIIFTIQAITSIASSAERYLQEGVMPDKAITLLTQVADYAMRENIVMITADVVASCVQEITGIPTGPIQEEERDGLLNLEERLHERVIGQGAAITAIAKTIRRARVDIERSDKPIGSFLFLGPTGVGKTETAKALAATFGSHEAALVRFDMSEFSDASGLASLLGTSDTSGLLTDQLHEHPYSVVLLDEFEKANQAVHDLFLQILDEGIFTNGRGEQVNARNTIIIATSNAGADLITRTVAARQSLRTLEHEIIQHIIKQGVLRPELINRFDSAIIFEPLTIDEQTEVTRLLITKLQARVIQQGYTLTVTPELIKYLAHTGYDPQFGARPLQRLIQDTLEENIAQQIIAGDVTPGDTIALNVSDVTNKSKVTAKE